MTMRISKKAKYDRKSLKFLKLPKKQKIYKNRAAKIQIKAKALKISKTPQSVLVDVLIHNQKGKLLYLTQTTLEFTKR